MATAILGIPYRVVYASKNLTTGVNGISAQLYRPNNTIAGTFALMPMPGGSYFSGLYYFDLLTSDIDPEGKWVGMILSPNEGNHRAPFSVVFQKRDPQVQDITSSFPQTYINRLSTTLDTSTNIQEVIAWAEKNGQATSGTDCTIIVKDGQGNVKWTATAPSPSADGVFRFTNPLIAQQDVNFYVVISITVDGLVRTNYQPFFTVG